MIEWNEYVSGLLKSGTDFDNLTISLDDGAHALEIPPLIRASILMLDRMTERQGILNVLVFPEKSQSIFIFTLMKLFHNISQGKISSSYSPQNFLPGEKLKVGNAVVEYLGFEEENGKAYILIRCADILQFRAPANDIIYQKASTNRKLSKYTSFQGAVQKAEAALGSGSEGLSMIVKMKTHMENSVFAVTSVAGVKEQLAECRIGGRRVTDLFYIAQTDFEGKLSNISPGQMSGIPAIVFASDLYAVNAAVDRGCRVQSVIIDGSNLNSLLNQLDALDGLIHLGVPVACVTDTADSFELEQLAARKFNIWRWDQDSITQQLCEKVPLSMNRCAENCIGHSLTWLKTKAPEISGTMKILAAHRHETKEQSPAIMQLYERLNGLTFDALREIAEPPDLNRDIALQKLQNCEEILRTERMYLSPTQMHDYESAISNLRTVYGYGYVFQKKMMLQELLEEREDKKVYIVIPERANKDRIQSYWNLWCRRNHMGSKAVVLFPSEYYTREPGEIRLTVICGWLKRAIMRKIIYSYVTNEYVVLLYDYEERWKKHDTRKWERALSNTSNREIIEKVFSTDDLTVSTKRFTPKSAEEDKPEEPDELGEIELILRENRFKRYVNGDHTGQESVPAIPVSFIGGYLAFYRTGHKLISATKIITENSDKIGTPLPSEVREGDFIVVREADQDMIRELADLALSNSGEAGARELSSKWREALNIELTFCTEEELYERFRAAGCNRGFATFKRWVEDEDLIAPQTKEDLKLIAEVTGNQTLRERLDDVFKAVTTVRNAHNLAGRKLSERLRNTLAAELKKFDRIDPFNFWEPISLDLEEIGSVKVLKVTDTGSEIMVDAGNTNRLIEGE